MLQTDGQDNGPIAYGEPFYKRSPKNILVQTRGARLNGFISTAILFDDNILPYVLPHHIGHRVVMKYSILE